MDSEAARDFDHDMYETCRIAKEELDYNPTRFLHMMHEDDEGGVGVAKQLLRPGAPLSDGFTLLQQRHRLELSVEAHVIMAKYEALFSQDVRDRARRRLEDCGYLPKSN